MKKTEIITKKSGTIFDIFSTLVTRFIILIGSFLVSVMLARLLGAEGKGAIAAILVFPQLVISLGDLGIRQSLAYFIGKKLYDNKDIISSIVFLWVLSSLILVGTVFIYFSINLSSRYPWPFLLIALSTIPVGLIIQYSKGVMLGSDNISSINIAQLIQVLFNILTILILVWILKLDVLGALIAQLIYQFIVTIYYIGKINKHYTINLKPVPPIPKELFKKGISFAIVLFVINLNYRVDIMILDIMVSTSEVGVYSVASNIAQLLWQIPSAIGMVLFAKSATTNLQVSSVNRATTIVRFVLPIMVLAGIFLGFLGPLIINILYGAEFIKASNVLMILLPGIIIITISKILHPDLAGRGYPLFSLSLFILTLAINIVLNLILIPIYGINGAALSSSISYTIAGFGFALAYSKKEKIALSKILFINFQDIRFLQHRITIFYKNIKKRG